MTRASAARWGRLRNLYEGDLDPSPVRVSTCTRRYDWLEGPENDYEVVIDADSGTLVCGRALGYVTDACGVTQTDLGTVSYGVRPEPSTCTTANLCGDDGHGGAGGRSGNAGDAGDQN